jgi:hypothetical protein
MVQVECGNKNTLLLDCNNSIFEIKDNKISRVELG